MNTHIPENEKDILSVYAERINKGHVERMAELGLGFAIGRREGSKVFDMNGKPYLDCYCSGGQYVLGHRNPEIIGALKDAIKTLDNGNFQLLSVQKAAFAKLLAETTPGDLKCSVFGVGRGESNEFAMKLSRGFTGRKDIIGFKGGSHGQTGFALSASDDEQRENLFGPLIPHVKHIPLDADALRKNVSDKTAAVIVEPVQSDAGVISPPAGFLAEARKVCDQHGAALIFDEGCTALGRTGKLFACEHDSVVPDILVMGRALSGNIYPITVAVFTSRLNRFMLTHPLIHLSTFGGSDVGCMVGIATINHVLKTRLWENADIQGRRLLSGLKDAVAGSAGTLKEARGIGMLAGVEAANTAAADSFVKKLALNGVIALPAQGNPAVVRFTPPADISSKDVDTIIDAIKAAAKA